MNEDKASRYHRLKRRSGVLSVAVTAGVLGAFLLSGASSMLADRARHLARAAEGHYSFLTVAIYVAVLAAIQGAAAFPLAG